MKNAVILMQSRTGSSMVAGIFRAHGWLTGGDKVVSRDYVTHENQAIKKYFVKHWGSPMQHPAHCREKEDELEAIVELEFGDEPWVWKGDVYYLPVWEATFPDVAQVYVQRDIEDAVRSGLAGRAFPLNERGRTVDYQEASDRLRKMLVIKYELMNNLAALGRGVVVDASQVMLGDLSTVEAAVRHCGGEWDEATARGVIRGR